MDDNEETEFEIERIIRRRVNRGNVQYLIKWKNFGAEHNSWTNGDDMTNCQSMLDEFLVQDIIAVKRNEDGIQYLLKWKFNSQPTTISSLDARNRFPQWLIDFLESKIIWTRNFGDLIFVDDNPVEEEENPIENPVEITYATNVTGQLKYWVVWHGNRNKFISSEEATAKWPSLVIDFLESNVKTD